MLFRSLAVAALAVITRRLSQARAALAAEVALEADGRRQLRALFDALPDLVWVKDLEGRYAACNRSFLQFIGLPEDEVIGRRTTELLALSLASELAEEDREALGTLGAVRAQHWFPTRDGGELLFDTARLALRDEAGDPVGVLGVARDVTATFRARASLIAASFSCTATRTAPVAVVPSIAASSLASAISAASLMFKIGRAHV